MQKIVLKSSTQSDANPTVRMMHFDCYFVAEIVDGRFDCLVGQQHLTVQTVPGGGLQLGSVQTQTQTVQVEPTQTLALELQSQPGEKKRRMACTCPNCKDAEKR